MRLEWGWVNVGICLCNHHFVKKLRPLALEPGMERCPEGLVTMQGNIFVRLACVEPGNAVGCKMLLKEVKLLHEKLSFLIKARAQYPNYGHGLTDQAVMPLIEGDNTVVYTLGEDSDDEIVDVGQTLYFDIHIVNQCSLRRQLPRARPKSSTSA